MEAKSNVVYFAKAEAEPEYEEELSRWYNEEHIPLLMKVPGYLGAKRYVAVEGGPKFLTFWEIESIDAYKSKAHDEAVDTPWTHKLRPHMKIQLEFSRQIFPESGTMHGVAWDQRGEGASIMVNRFDLEPSKEAEYNAWYEEEHIPALCQVPGVIGARRFKDHDGKPAYTALYYLTEPGVQASDAWKSAAASPRGDRARDAVLTRWRSVYVPL